MRLRSSTNPQSNQFAVVSQIISSDLWLGSGAETLNMIQSRWGVMGKAVLKAPPGPPEMSALIKTSWQQRDRKTASSPFHSIMEKNCCEWIGRKRVGFKVLSPPLEGTKQPERPKGEARRFNQTDLWEKRENITSTTHWRQPILKLRL